ncbi:MAG: 16S rRNA (cytosine(1402)-N(4))-methyltransferase RsmH [Alphaproteobacteria bacterium]|nr:16S rRNA (cytosine(1402)-N(4))-methyltransferase RsmH [Alphaproteobacteria bacterium]
MSGHVPVLLAEVLDIIRPRDGAHYIDGTFGGGGYSRALLDSAKCRVLGIDRDPDAIARGQELVARYEGRLKLSLGNFSQMEALLAAAGEPASDGVLLDLGVSSFQFDQPERGFSFREDGPLDMRMSRSGPSAADVVNSADEKALIDIIFRYGEERQARRIARAIIAARPILRTAKLAEVVSAALGPAAARQKIHPATRTFQALRIIVNEELGELERGLDAAERVLKEGGRLAVVAFHSLEDRIVKHFLAERSAAASKSSRHAPEHGRRHAQSFRLLTSRPVMPGEEEILSNPRSRSARLRAAERLAAPAA